MTHITYPVVRSWAPGLVAIPTVDWMYTESVQALFELRDTLPIGSEMRLMPQTSSPVATKREMLAHQMLSNPEWQWICYIDSDMVPPPYAVARLLSHKLPIVSAIYAMRQPPYAPCVMWLNSKWPSPEAFARPVPVRNAGFGCILIQRDVFLNMGSPWFAENPEDPGLGEDYLFCDRARAAGYSVHLDAELEVGHLGITSITPAYGRAWQATPEGQAAVAHELRAGRAQIGTLPSASDSSSTSQLSQG
jgi:hypothetical protein